MPQRQQEHHGWTWVTSPEASSFLQAMGSHETKGEESTKAQKFQVFVKNLVGKTVVVRGFSGLDEVSLVVSQVELLTGVPCSLFYLVGASGRRLRENVTLEQSGIGPDSLLIMSARVKGVSMRQRGPLVPGSWTCSNCNMGGCWPSKNVCFRCLAPRPTRGPLFLFSHTGKGDATFGQGAASATFWQSHGKERHCSVASASTCP